METMVTRKQHEDVGRFFDLIKSPSGIVEARFLRPDGKAVSRYYDDRKRFTDEVLILNSKGWTSYAGIQPRRASLMGTKKAGVAEDVVALHILPMEFDPIRYVEVAERDGKTVTAHDGAPLADAERIEEVNLDGRSFKAVRRNKLNATDEEKARCLKTASLVVEKMTNGQGYTAPLVMDSGNGCWILKRIPEISVTNENRTEIAARLKGSGSRAARTIEAPGVDLDVVIYDIPRIMKVPGTRVFNKPEVPGRPQRVSAILTEGIPEPDEKMLKDFMSIKVEMPLKAKPVASATMTALKPDRIFEKCYALRFLREKGESGVSLPHDVRLALSSFSLVLGDLENNLQFIEKILGGCPDYSREKTRYQLEHSKKSAPYGCEALRKQIERHYADFDVSKCACALVPSTDRSGKTHKPSPIRFAYPQETDLIEDFDKIEFSGDSFKDFALLREFTRDSLTSFPEAVSKRFLESRKEQLKKQNKIKLKNEDIKSLLAYRRNLVEPEKEKVETVEVNLSDSEREAALERLRSPSLLYDYGQFIKRLGVIGEEKNVLILLLVFVTRLFDQLISLVIKAESSTGKSFILKTCLRVLPEECFEVYTSMSDKAIIYTEKDFRHKFLIFYEFAGQSEEVDHLVRTLQSEGRLRYEVSVKGEEGGYETITIDKPGPTGFITTTTKPQLFDENETRIFSIYADESDEQTKKILEKLGAQFESGEYEVPETEVESWKNVQRVLEPYKVRIPYAGWLSQRIPYNKVRIRRDYERVLYTVAACALLHQLQRERITEEGEERVLASLDDYCIVRDLIEGALVDTVQGLSKKTSDLVDTVTSLQDPKEGSPTKDDSDEKGETGWVKMSDILRNTRASRRSVYYWLEPAIEVGLVEKHPRKKGFYRATGRSPNLTRAFSFLPPVEEILEAFPEMARKVRFVHPLTGETIAVEDDEEAKPQ